MPTFDVSREWTILLPSEAVNAKKAAEDLSRYIGLLASFNKNSPTKAPVITDTQESNHPGAIIVLNSAGNSPVQNGFSWRAGTEQVEIYGESDRGLCNGIYSFLSALGINWPAPGKEILPRPGTDLQTGLQPGTDPQTDLPGLPLAVDKAYEPSQYTGDRPIEAPLRRFIPDGKKAINNILKNSEAFAAWTARKRYDAIIFPLTAFSSGSARRKLKQLIQTAGAYGISLEAGGRDLSSLVPRKYFLLHRDFFRMVEGRRKKNHHFCPTNPGTIRIINKEGAKLFRAAEGIKVFHLWPDKGAENVWCSCPTCRAFAPPEQNRIAVNAAADVLTQLNPDALITYIEEAGTGGNIPLRKNLSRLERLPNENESFA